MASIDKLWYEPNPLSVLLLPLAWLFCLIAILRRFFYRSNIFKAEKLPVPVIVVGNITVGGTGKTPLVVAIIEHLKKQGFNPGIVSRGYGGKAVSWPQTVTENSDPAQVGDEAVLLARRCQCPMSVGPNRPQAARALLDKHSCNVIISDDGLQHYALHRNIEVVVLDGTRRLGNNRCLPAGPLREPAQRLVEADYVVANGMAQRNEIEMILHMQAARNLKDSKITQELSELANKSVHAVAGIGNPQRFFSQLKSMRINVIEHAFKDHHPYSKNDIQFNDELPVLMTEKDAVKCLPFAQDNHWYVPVAVEVNKKFLENLTEQVRKYNGQKTA
ncbi:MAG: tetraacyldisaccharide 4'-kinase [Gammaproteobacteria bacterium]|jgi:tetraacyldisaccharide 4'-kinase